jgi:hypothetical protein
MMPRTSAHDECWLLLPWLANGRLSAAEGMRAQAHVSECAQCARELEAQSLLCAALTEPERITYAPGPSFRKLMARIDGTPRPATPVRVPARAAAGATLAAAWRPPGLAWAATFVLTVGLGVLVATAYHWSQPSYVTATSAARATPDVLHIAFERSLPVGDVEELLSSAGARVVEGPGNGGVFGVAPVGISDAHPGVVSPEMRALAARLRADPRVRWIEPLAVDHSPEPARGASSQDP